MSSAVNTASYFLRLFLSLQCLYVAQCYRKTVKPWDYEYAVNILKSLAL